MNKIEHIGIAVKNLDETEKIYSKLFGTTSYKREKVESEGVITSFFKIGNSKIELLAATDYKSPIHKFIEKHGAGMHHIAFEVEDIVKELKRLESEGFVLINKLPKSGADDKLVAFLHPKSTDGVLIEICQEKK